MNLRLRIPVRSRLHRFALSLSIGVGACGLSLPTTTAAAVKLPAIIGDNMVLQAGLPARIWGWANPGEAVRVSFGGVAAQTVTAGDGTWSVELAPQRASTTPGTLVVTGDNRIEVRNVLVGEVWLCSGQSNMAFPVEQADDAEAEIAAATHPTLRLFTVKRALADDAPAADCVGRWVECAPGTVADFSAVGYFFGRDLQAARPGAVGLIHSSWSGTKAKAWMPRSAFEARPELRLILEDWSREMADFPRAKAEFEANRPRLQAEWEEQAAAAAAEGKAAPATPRLRTGPNTPYVPTTLYNAMIAPLTPLRLRGAVWYQGESDVGAPQLYRESLGGLITSWRAAWGLPELPFIVVQLPNLDRQPEPTRSGWPELREAQLKMLEVPDTALVVTIDVGDPQNLHPTRKQPVGQRVALAARGLVYGADRTQVWSPVPAAATSDGDRLRVAVQYAGDGLKTADGAAPRGFVVAGADRVFHPAQARLAGAELTIFSAAVPAPIAARYDWADNPDGNVVSGSGLPLAPFRTDDWATMVTVVNELK